MAEQARRAGQRRRRRTGRPPAGAQAGERVRDYPQLSIRLPPEAKLKLGALSVVRSQPQWRIVLESINCLLASLPEADRQMAHKLIKRPLGRRKPLE